jgi:hypothetical protein
MMNLLGFSKSQLNHPVMTRQLVGMTPLLKKEGKLLIYNTIYFSSLLRRSTLTEASGGGGCLFQYLWFFYIDHRLNNSS